MNKVDPDTLQEVEQTLDVVGVKRFEPYPEYKPTGVEWLGDVPEHWEVKRFKHSVQLINDKIEISEEHKIPYIGMEHVESWTGKTLPLDDDFAPVGITNVFSSNDVLFGKLRPYLAKACAPNLEGICTSELIVLRPNTIDKKFLLYTVLSYGFIKLVDSSTFGAKMPRANWEFVGDIRIPVPEQIEQKSIARFLDEQTQKIDDLIEAKRKLLDLLKEKRQAIITHAVTKGIDPDVKMKPSGIEWLGDVPEQWEVKKLKRTVQVINEKIEISEENKIPYVGMEHVESWTGKTSPLDDEFTPVGITNVFSSNDVLFGKLRPYLAKACAPNFEGICSSELIVLRPNLIDRKFLLYAILSYGFIKLVDSSTFGAKMPRANWEFIGGMHIPIPEQNEQRVIARFLDKQTQKIDHIISETNKAIERLTEYRIALISAAVTGKIDVRGRAS